VVQAVTPASIAAAAAAKWKNDAIQVTLPFDAREKYPVGLKILLDESIYPTPAAVRQFTPPLPSTFAHSFVSELTWLSFLSQL
jgi:hypothetical protein